MPNRARLAHKTHGVKISKNSRVQIFTASYFAALIFTFWSWVGKIVKISHYTVGEGLFSSILGEWLFSSVLGEGLFSSV